MLNIKKVMMPTEGIIVPGLCPPYPIRPEDFLCPRMDKAEFSMDGFSEDRMLPGTDEVPYDGVNPPTIGEDLQDLPRVENQEAGLTAEMDTSGMDTAGMSDVSAMS